jgi:hypothetical protein
MTLSEHIASGTTLKRMLFHLTMLLPLHYRISCFYLPWEAMISSLTTIVTANCDSSFTFLGIAR